MIVWGGRDATGASYDPATNTWEDIPSIGMPAGESDPTIWMGGGFTWSQAVWTGSKLIVWSGLYGSVPSSTGAIFDPVLNTWSPTSIQNAPAGRYVGGSVWTGSKMIIWGGYDGAPQAVNSGGVFTP